MQRILCLVLSILVICSSAFAQVTFEDMIDSDGTQSIITTPVEPGTTLEDIVDHNELDFEQSDLDPGIPLEGDYIGKGCFTPDGGRILFPNRATDNVTVYDNETGDMITNIEVGTYPGEIACSDEYAVVACAFSDEIYVIDLSDYSIAGIFDSGEQPWVVRISNDGARAFVACDIDDVCEVINLETLTHERTIQSFPIALLSYSMSSEHGRLFFNFSDFEVTADDGFVFAGAGRDSVSVFTVETGEFAAAVHFSQFVRNVALSGDGEVAVTVSSSTPVIAYQLDPVNWVITDSVVVEGYSQSFLGLAVNQDGSKAMFGTSSNTTTIVDFADDNYTMFSETYSAFWTGVNYDHSLGISGQYRFSVIDFDTESVLGQFIGRAQYYGTVSPVSNYAASLNPFGREGVMFFDYTTPNSPDYLGITDAGETPEGDAPRRVAITPDGSKALIVNIVSENVTILNLETYEIEAILYVGERAQNVAITPDGSYAVACGYENGIVAIIDLELNMVIAEVACGQRPGVISISPDGGYAYVGNIQSNTVSVVALLGAASMEVAEVPCGVIGVSMAAFGVQSDVEVTPSGNYVCVAASFDDQLKVIDTSTNQVVASIGVGDFPLQIETAEFFGQEYAFVSNFFSDQVSIVYVDGANSSLMGTFTSGDGPFRVAYDETQNRFATACYYDRTLRTYDIQSGQQTVETTYPNNYGNPIQVEYDGEGTPICLFIGGQEPASRLVRGDEEPALLPATASFFDYCPAVEKAVATMPGPDWVTVVDWDTTGVEEQVSVGGTIPDTYQLHAPYPNPFNSTVTVQYSLPEMGNVHIQVYDALGREVAVLTDGNRPAGHHTLSWNADVLSSGTYFIQMTAGNYTNVESVTLVK